MFLVLTLKTLPTSQSKSNDSNGKERELVQLRTLPRLGRKRLTKKATKAIESVLAYRKHPFSIVPNNASHTFRLDGPRIATKTVKVVNGPSTSPDTLVFKFHYRTSGRPNPKISTQLPH